jgi:hypothetical protein
MRGVSRRHPDHLGLAVRFHFHTQTDVRVTDTEGTEYPGYAEARREAIRTCGQMMQDAPEQFWGSRPWSVTVTDATGLILWDIQLDGTSPPAGKTLEPDGSAST